MRDPQPGFHALAADAKTRVPEVTVAAVAQYPAGRFLLIDVRDQDEFSRGHIPGAIHMSKGIIERDIEQRIPDQRTPLVLYCQKGFRSALAADNLRRMGYANVSTMSGGIEAWAASGYPVTGAR